MAVPKKRTSKSKTKNRKNVWKKKAYRAAAKALSYVKSEYIYSELELYGDGDWKIFPVNSPERKPEGFPSSIAEEEKYIAEEKYMPDMT
uniref:Large ribosomal subunit protein bL32c n=1 Tax=Sequoiadendron giganteum TaxID=99814 RepID=A0A6J4AI27_9CONI|nr:ribosomal protein L32 [Sequoiadendron giganteum]BBN66907.1 ribosomal protein L32 [Sequoiadendron giganteum]